MVDRVRALKLETPAEGGSSTDVDQTEVNPHSDFLDAAGVTLQDATSADATVLWQRGLGTLQGIDQLHTSAVPLAAMSTMYEGGPAINTVYYVATGTPPTVTQESWYSDSAKTKLVKSIAYTATANIGQPSPIVTKFYGVDGATVIATFTDTITYNTAGFMTAMTRVRS